MPKTTISTRRKAPQKRASRKAKAPAKTRTKSAPKATRKPTRQTRKGNGKAIVRRSTGFLPKPIDVNDYMQRTVAIFEEGERKHANLRKRQVRQLGELITDFQNDVSANITLVEKSTQRSIDRLAHRVRSTRLVQEAIMLPERITDTFDGLLERVGLVRRSVYIEAVGE